MPANPTLELLLDLKHDLGKYMLLPLAFLPRDADAAAVRAALARGLLRTRSRRTVGGEETQSAREIWQASLPALRAGTLPQPALVELEGAMERALAWERVLHDDVAFDRVAVERDLLIVQRAFAELLQDMIHG
jgi:hypothetical protein